MILDQRVRKVVRNVLLNKNHYDNWHSLSMSSTLDYSTTCTFNSQNSLHFINLIIVLRLYKKTSLGGRHMGSISALSPDVCNLLSRGLAKISKEEEVNAKWHRNSKTSHKNARCLYRKSFFYNQINESMAMPS